MASRGVKPENELPLPVSSRRKNHFIPVAVRILHPDAGKDGDIGKASDAAQRLRHRVGLDRKLAGIVNVQILAAAAPF
jgi:hypothetical protein